MQPSSTELILIRVTGEDRPGLTSSVTEILAKYDATILDIGQADIHNTLSLGILFKSEEGIIIQSFLFGSNHPVRTNYNRAIRQLGRYARQEPLYLDGAWP